MYCSRIVLELLLENEGREVHPRDFKDVVVCSEVEHGTLTRLLVEGAVRGT